AEQSIVWITASEDGASATCVGVAPACKELRSGPNKSEREHTSERSTKRERTPNPSFPWHWAHLFIAAVSPLGCRVLQHRRPLGLVLERQSSQAKDGFVESKRFQLCFVRSLPRRGQASRASFTKTRIPPESALGGGVSGTLIW